MIAGISKKGGKSDNWMTVILEVVTEIPETAAKFRRLGLDAMIRTGAGGKQDCLDCCRKDRIGDMLP